MAWLDDRKKIVAFGTAVTGKNSVQENNTIPGGKNDGIVIL
jgi:hypothetical protein